MAKRKQNGELFINKAPWSSVEVKHEVEIHELMTKISDDKNKPIVSPKFNLGGVEMSIRVDPNDEGSGFIGVSLHNYSDQDLKCSATFKTLCKAGARICSWERDIIKPKGDWGFGNFLSHSGYKKWAAENGDVFKLEVSLCIFEDIVATDCWTR